MKLIRLPLPGFHRLPNLGRLADWHEEMDHLLAWPLSGLTEISRHFAGRTPALDVYEDKENFVIKAELPGMKREEINVSMQDGAVTISGERKNGSEHKAVGVYRTERSMGRFQRTLALPTPVAADQVKANYQDGILTVTLPKTAEAKPKQIKVSVK